MNSASQSADSSGHDTIALSSKPKIFRITVSGDSVATITGGLSDKWKRIPSKFPPSSLDVQWIASSLDFPAGESKLGTVKFQKSGEVSRMIHMEWLDQDSNVLCKDSVILGESSSFYELSDVASDVFIEVPNDILRIEYVNSYTSTSDGVVNIFDRQTHAPVKSHNAKPNVISNMNGLNRMSIPLNDYHLDVGKFYTLSVRDAQSMHSLNFKKTSENGTTTKGTNENEK
jgi:hypothetical protein